MNRLFLFLIALFWTPLASAEVSYFPLDKVKDPTRTAVLFEDPAISLLLEDSTKTLGVINASVHVATSGDENFYIGSGIVSTLRQKGITFFSEALDLRVTFSWVHPFSKTLFLSSGFMHTSGHVMDDSPDKELEPPNAGLNGFPSRLVYDSGEMIKTGLHTQVLLGSPLESRHFLGGAFAEVYPFSRKTNEGWFFATDIYVPVHNDIEVSTITEVGYVQRSARLVAGYHQGADPRLKYQLIRASISNFWFGGVAFDL